MFSLGCIALEMLSSEKFFPNSWMIAYASLSDIDSPEFNRKVNDAINRAQLDIESHHPVGVADFVSTLLSMAASDRMNATRARCHQWIIHTNKLLAADTMNSKDPRHNVMSHSSHSSGKLSGNIGSSKFGSNSSTKLIVVQPITVSTSDEPPHRLPGGAGATARSALIDESHTDDDENDNSDDDGGRHKSSSSSSLPPNGKTPVRSMKTSEAPPNVQVGLFRAYSKGQLTKSGSTSGRLLSSGANRLERGFSFVGWYRSPC